MTLPLALAINAVADIALMGGLAWLMTRPAKLTPHAPAAARLAVVPAERQDAHPRQLIAA